MPGRGPRKAGKERIGDIYYSQDNISDHFSKGWGSIEKLILVFKATDDPDSVLDLTLGKRGRSTNDLFIDSFDRMPRRLGGGTAESKLGKELNNAMCGRFTEEETAQVTRLPRL